MPASRSFKIAVAVNVFVIEATREVVNRSGGRCESRSEWPTRVNQAISPSTTMAAAQPGVSLMVEVFLDDLVELGCEFWGDFGHGSRSLLVGEQVSYACNRDYQQRPFPAPWVPGFPGMSNKGVDRLSVGRGWWRGRPARPRPTVGTGCPRYDECGRGPPVGWA